MLSIGKCIEVHRFFLLFSGNEMKYNLSEGRIETTTIPREVLTKVPSLLQKRKIIETFAGFKTIVDKLQPLYQSMKCELYPNK